MTPGEGVDRVTRAGIGAIWRIESPRLVARLTRLLGDLATAEDVAQDTFATAIGRWTTDGVPDNPGGWLWHTGRQRAIDVIRRRDLQHDRYATLANTTLAEPDMDILIDEHDIGDDLLGLVFMTCHPILSPGARVALTLRSVGGLTTTEIARAFLTPEATIAQRIVRAKRALTDADVRFEHPGRVQRSARLPAVMEVIYLIFNEGHAATAGEQWIRTDLCADGMRLGRVLTTLVSDNSEVWALLALMELQASRLQARTGPNGEAILLGDQDRGRWDRILIDHAMKAMGRSEELCEDAGPYLLQAQIAACHARAASIEVTDWTMIAGLYETMSRVAPSPIVELNRAVALGRAFGPAVGLGLADQLLDVVSMQQSHLLAAVRGDLLENLGRFAQARQEYERAASLTANDTERVVLQAHAARCATNEPQ